ncbi:hypothetical protein A2V68_00195 [candidate division Kazan bacterium RBG_13_50_9]|uniref:DUF5667 domain-containing protein n=1 Tax=candidate division Kazan bacterium RBG_13_50_9 TaxID=1798535 RepID=A0A1F4NRY7_UNCK3|nr:MAG: hypothetical protein A2V68_00195 [candidate division Kazan bacterium RBG_13_50_9]
MDKFDKLEQEIIRLLKAIKEGILLTPEERAILKVKLTDTISESVTTQAQNRYKKQAYKLNIEGVTMPFVPIVIAILLAGGAGTAALADSSAPGQPLYGLDQAMERFQEKITSHAGAKAQLWARMSEERAQELLALRNMNPEQMAERAREMWEKHQEEAVDRLAQSIEKVGTLQDKFEEKLAAAENDSQKAAYQQVIDHLSQVIEKRETRLDEIESGEFPGVGNLPIRQRLQEWKNASSEVRDQIHEMIQEEFGGELPGFGLKAGRQAQNAGGADESVQGQE